MNYARLLVAIAVILVSHTAQATDEIPSKPWVIARPTLAKHDDRLNDLQFSVVSKDGATKFDLSSLVSLQSVNIYFTYRNQLVVAGRAGNVDEVIVFDLLDRKQTDAFYCYKPTPVSPNLITYVEWSPNHSREKIKDVVLIYNLDLSPNRNRLSGEAVNVEKPGVHVGFPVYPESNLVARSYVNVVQTDEEVTQVLGVSGFVMMDSKRLVFAAASGGGDYRTLRNYLVDVDLSEGLDRAQVRIIPIPKNELKLSGENPEFIEIFDLKTASSNSVSLLIPKSIYGVDKIDIHIP